MAIVVCDLCVEPGCQLCRYFILTRNGRRFHRWVLTLAVFRSLRPFKIFPPLKRSFSYIDHEASPARKEVLIGADVALNRSFCKPDIGAICAKLCSLALKLGKITPILIRPMKEERAGCLSCRSTAASDKYRRSRRSIVPWTRWVASGSAHDPVSSSNRGIPKARRPPRWQEAGLLARTSQRRLQPFSFLFPPIILGA